MISETVLLWLGTMALLVNYTGLARAETDESKVIAFVFALVMWLAFTMNALSYQTYSGGTTIPVSSQSLWLLGILGVVGTIVLLIDAGFSGIKNAFGRVN